MINEVVAGVLVDAVAASGRRLGTAASALANRGYADDIAIARWFDTYQLTKRVPALPDLLPETGARLAETLRANELQAVLQELLAARLTDAPETDVERIRTLFDLTLQALSPPSDEVASISTTLFDYYDTEVCTLVGRLEGAEPSLLHVIRGEAHSTRIIATLHAIERHTAALTSRPEWRTEEDFLATYRQHLIEQHGKLEPPDFERRHRVPISHLYVQPQIFHLIEQGTERASRELKMGELAAAIDRTVLLGEPGGGKTTAANVLLHYHAIDKSRRLPFLVTLREFAVHDPPERSVVGYIEYRLETFYQCPAPSGLVSQLLLSGRAVVIFDGLDELLDTSRRAEVTTRVERFCSEYPLAPVLVTSRVVGYDQARLDDRQFSRYRIGGFADNQVADYARKWFAQEQGFDAEEAAKWASAFMEESATTPDLRANPLMLALMCILYRGEGALPRNRAEVYEQCANLLFRKWDARRRIHIDLRAGRYLEPALRHLAWWLFSCDETQPAVTERELIDKTTAFLIGRGFELESDARDAASEFVGFCRGRMWVFSDTGTTAAGQTLYSFTHRTFLEYFAAANLAYGCDTPERLARSVTPHAARREWDVVGELAVQIKDRTSDHGAQRIYAAMLSERRHRAAAGRSNVLQFLARCLRSVDPSPHVIRNVTRVVLDHLLAGDLDDPVRCLPLCWLMANCTTCKDVVADEISARISALILSSDAVSRLNGLHLALWLPVAISGDWGGDGPRVSRDGLLWRFWQGRRDANVRTHAKSITAACDDIGIRFGALTQDIITVDQALQMTGGLLSLFKHQSIELFGIERSAYLLDVVAGLILGWPGYCAPDTREPSPKAVSDLEGIGRYLINNPQPPWITEPVDAWPDFFWSHRAMHDTSGMILDSAAYLGATAILLITVECMKSRVLLAEYPERFGVLSKVFPYIERRYHIEPDCTLPSLPVPADFQTMFRDWANKRINFVDICSPEGGPPSGMLIKQTDTCHRCHSTLYVCQVCRGSSKVPDTFGNCTECNGVGFVCSTHGKYWNN